MTGNEGIEAGSKVIYNENVEENANNQKVENDNKNYKLCKTNCKDKFVDASKHSNHIKFIDYIPTHEVITYRHLFAYGFYIV